MEKKNQKKQGKDGALLLVAILVAAVLLICFATLAFIKMASKTNAKLLTATNDSSLDDSSQSDDMLLQLEEVQTYLETLESEVSDSTLKLNTLVAKEDDNSEKTAMEKESIDSAKQVLGRLNEINESLQQTRNELLTIVNNMNQGDKESSRAFLDSINNLYSRLEEIDAETNNTLNKIKMIDANNTDEILTAFRDFENRLKKKDEGETDKYDALLEIISEKLKETQKALTEESKKNTEAVMSSLEQVFGFVANGKKVIASALATVGSNIDLDAYYEFLELGNMIEHSQDIEGTYTDSEMTEKLLAGAIEDNLPVGTAAWVEGRYVVGNGKDISAAYDKGYTDGYNKGIADGVNKALDGLRTEYVYHVHEGNSSECGGCYTVPVYHQHVDASGNLRSANYQAGSPGGCFNHKVTYTTDCGCKGKGHSVVGKLVTSVTPNYYSDYCNTCNHWCGSSTRQYYTCNCGLSEDITGYALSCGKTEDTLERVTIYFEDEPVLTSLSAPAPLTLTAGKAGNVGNAVILPEEETLPGEETLPNEETLPEEGTIPEEETLPEKVTPPEEETLPNEEIPPEENDTESEPNDETQREVIKADE